jgi:hypothetical protein
MGEIYCIETRKFKPTMMFATSHSVTSNASFASPLLTVDEHPSIR